jgi:hypothetical protein
MSWQSLVVIPGVSSCRAVRVLTPLRFHAPSLIFPWLGMLFVHEFMTGLRDLGKSNQTSSLARPISGGLASLPHRFRFIDLMNYFFLRIFLSFLNLHPLFAHSWDLHSFSNPITISSQLASGSRWRRFSTRHEPTCFDITQSC